MSSSSLIALCLSLLSDGARQDPDPGSPQTGGEAWLCPPAEECSCQSFTGEAVSQWQHEQCSDHPHPACGWAAGSAVLPAAAPGRPPHPAAAAEPHPCCWISAPIGPQGHRPDDISKYCPQSRSETCSTSHQSPEPLHHQDPARLHHQDPAHVHH